MGAGMAVDGGAGEDIPARSSAVTLRIPLASAENLLHVIPGHDTGHAGYFQLLTGISKDVQEIKKTLRR